MAPADRLNTFFIFKNHTHYSTSFKFKSNHDIHLKCSRKTDMKYFYFQMLKDKKIIIHKTDGKTFIPVTGRSYRTNSSYGFRLSFFNFLSLYAIPAAIVSSVKQGGHTIPSVI